MTHSKMRSREALTALALGIATFATPHAALASSDPYVGEIAPMGIVGFCPAGWASAEGQILPITENNALFALIGTTLAAAPDGGTGQETIYSDQAANVQMSTQMITPSGGGQPVGVQDPTQVIRYCIALQGIFPPRS